MKYAICLLTSLLFIAGARAEPPRAPATTQAAPPAPRPQSLQHGKQILVIGDSNTHNGHFTGALAELLEKDHGYFGSGYRSVVADVGNGQAGTYQPYLRISNNGGWKSQTFIGGEAIAIPSPDGTCLASDNPADEIVVGFYGTSIDTYYAAQPKGGKLKIAVDGAAPREIDTAAEKIEVRRERIDSLAADAWHELSIRPSGGASVTVTGVESHNGPTDGAAAVLHKWGRSYAATAHFAGLRPEAWESSLKLLKPDWVVIMLGTNDHLNFAIAQPAMLNQLAILAERVRRFAPDSRILLLSTVPVNEPPSMSGRLRLRYLEKLPELAAALGVDYWDLAAACGPKQVDWIAKNHTKDHVHFNQAGAEAIAPQLLEVIERATAKPAPQPEPLRRQGGPPKDRPSDLGSLRVWLAADAPVALDSTGRVVEWVNTVDQTSLPEYRRNPMARTLPPSMRPLWVPNAVNGKPAIRFDGKGTSLTFMSPAQAAGFVAVVQVNAPGGALFGSQMALYQRFGPGAAGTNQLLNPATAEFKGTCFLNGRPLSNDAIEVPFKQYVLLSCEGGGGGAIIGANDFYKRYTKGPGDPETLSFLDGDIAELVIWSQLAPRNKDQRLIIERYLAAKYNIPLNSPATQPAP